MGNGAQRAQSLIPLPGVDSDTHMATVRLLLTPIWSPTAATEPHPDNFQLKSISSPMISTRSPKAVTSLQVNPSKLSPK